MNNVMSRFIKLYTHNDIGHNNCKDTDNEATHNNTQNGNRIDIRDEARKCTWRNTNSDTLNVCVMFHAIKPYLQMMPKITDDDATNNTRKIPVKILATIFTIVPENYTRKGYAVMHTIIPTIIFTIFSAIVPAITHTYTRKNTCNNSQNTHKCFCNGIHNYRTHDEGYPIGYPP